LVAYPGCFAWHELMTTDVAAAKAFYGNVLGWEVLDASIPELPYSLFTAGKVPVCGVMDLPEEGRRMGARPRWMGYVAVNDVEVTADRIKRLGGAVFVQPTDANIGRISVVADPQTAIFALISGLKVGRQQPLESGKSGRVGWHELLAADWERAFAFYSEIFGWQKPHSEISQEEIYHPFSACGLTIGGMFTRHPTDPPPFWLLYFNVEDIEAAEERVKAAGGQAFPNPIELPGGVSIARCADPQGAVFALQGRLGQTSKLGWSTEWSGFSSKGRLVGQKPRGRGRSPDSER
jgi:predicted enzyme related to lactoylglutathione lyase